MTVHTASIGVRRLVYLLVANRPIKYAKDYSRIVYIGTTERGIRRVASSASSKATQALEQLHGIRRLDAFVVWSRSKKGRQTVKGQNFWRILERGLIISFRRRYGEIPRLNNQGTGFKERNEFAVFARKNVERIISRYA